MKKYLNIAIIAIMTVVMTSCNGNGGTTSTQQDNSTQLEQQKQDSIREANAMAEAERLQKVKEDSLKRAQEERERIEAEKKKKEWHGANSRSELKEKLNGTTWETVEPYNLTGLVYRFEINGNKVKWLSAKPTRNYDDTKSWDLQYTFLLDDIAEPKRGTFCVILRPSNEDDIENLAATILVFRDENAYYTFGGEIGPSLKKIN